MDGAKDAMLEEFGARKAQEKTSSREFRESEIFMTLNDSEETLVSMIRRQRLGCTSAWP